MVLASRLVVIGALVVAACEDAAPKPAAEAGAPEMPEVPRSGGDPMPFMRKLVELLDTIEAQPDAADVRDKRAVFAEFAQRGPLHTARDELERELTDPSLDGRARYASLKAYLLLTDPRRLGDPSVREWEEDELGRRIMARWKPVTREPDVLLEAVGRVLREYLTRMSSGEAGAVSLDERMVAVAREAIGRDDAVERIHATMLAAVEGARRDPLGSSAPKNLRYPPVTLASIFQDRPEVLKHLRSADGRVVRGPYTASGLIAVTDELLRMRSEDWVVPSKGLKRDVAAAFVRYHDEYVSAWRALLADIRIEAPADDRTRLELLGALTKNEAPLVRVISVLEENTQGLGTQKFSTEEIREEFQDIVELAFPAGGEGSAAQAYLAILSDLHGKLSAPGANSKQEVDRARKKAEQLLEPKSRVRDALGEMLLAPLR